MWIITYETEEFWCVHKEPTLELAKEFIAQLAYPATLEFVEQEG